MAEALITGLAGLTARTIEPLVSRLTDLGLEKPAALLGGLPARPRPGRPTRRLHQGASGRRPRTRRAGWSDDGRYIDAGATHARREHRDPAASGSARTPRVSRRSTRGQAQSLRGGLASREALRGVVARRVAHRMASHVGRRRSRAVYRRRRCAGRRSRSERGERDPRRQSGRSDRPADGYSRAGVGQHADRPGRREAEGVRQAGTGTGPLPCLASCRPGEAELAGDRSIRRRRATSTDDRIERLTTATDKDARISALAAFEDHPDDAAIPAVRQAWMSDPWRMSRRRQ